MFFKPGRLYFTLVLSVFLLHLSPAQAALPQAMGGEELPSLAPMLEEVTPAVVNIATEGSTLR